MQPHESSIGRMSSAHARFLSFSTPESMSATPKRAVRVG
jgi:hypothetical protein